MLLDSHFHLDFLDTTAARAHLIDTLRDQDVKVIPQTLTPDSFTAQRGTHPLLSLGFHPWNIDSREQAEQQLAVFARELEHTRFIGEVGLDFVPRRLERTSQELQEYVLSEIFRMIHERVCAGNATDTLPVVISLHAVHSSGRVLDLLEESELDQLAGKGTVAPVFHWFSGNSDELTRLRDMGCLVSVNPKMLEAKRGRAYVRQLPADRLLLETDLPGRAGLQVEQADEVAASVLAALRGTTDLLGELRGEDMSDVLLANQLRLLGEPSLSEK